MALLIAGGAVVLVGGMTGCGGKKVAAEHSDEAMITRTVDSLELLSSENGIKKNLVITPLMETHALAKDPFDEYRKGIETRGYDEKTGLENLRVTADYALHFTQRELWDLKGNVLVVGEEGRQLFTQQLFWDEKLDKFYSNVDTKVTDGPNQTVGTGFEAAEDLSRWTFRQVKGLVYIDTEPTTDSLSVSPAADSLSVGPVADSLKVSPSPAPVREQAAPKNLEPARKVPEGAKKLTPEMDAPEQTLVAKPAERQTSLEVMDEKPSER